MRVLLTHREIAEACVAFAVAREIGEPAILPSGWRFQARPVGDTIEAAIEILGVSIDAEPVR